ncbi:MAG: alpha-glucan family phosphorylase [Pyrinomonadaceae bacterium]
MKELSSGTDTYMQPAMGIEPDQIFRQDFSIKRELPANLKALEELSQNFYWSWNPEGVELFRELEPGLWERCEQNPRLLLKRVSQLRLWQKADDAQYVAKLEEFVNRSRAYLDVSPKTFEGLSEYSPAAYFCAEYGVHNSFPNYSGGLGILAGDHLKSASDLNVPLVAIGLLYRFGYFRQKIAHDGWQEEKYTDVFDSELAITPVYDRKGQRIQVSVHIRGREVFAQAWLAKVGRISLYLLDTNVRQNAHVDRMITGHLYGGDAETRIVQEKVLGIGGVRLLRALGVEPAVYHLNEGHSAFLTLELAREFISSNPGSSFDEAARNVRRNCVFTTHTPVEAGNDVFDPKLLRECFSTEFLRDLNLDEDSFLALGRTDQADLFEYFGMTPLALRMSRSANGVSLKHGEVSRSLWLKMFPSIDHADSAPITHITNGVHQSTWIAPALQRTYVNKIGFNWVQKTRDPNTWASALNKLSDDDIWNAHQISKELLIAFIRDRTRSKETGLMETINEHEDTRKLFSPDVLTIGFARRVAKYKRWNLLLTDLDRLLRMVDDPDRPVQFVFAGKAHPQDRTAKQILQQLMSINNNSNWQNRAVFIEDYDQEVARYLVHGVDVWMNVPRRPLEASGTSGQKAAMNGVLNFSVLDGWWVEGYNGKNGFAIGELNVGDDEEVDAQDAESLYSTLENVIIPTFYDRGAGQIPLAWITGMREALMTLTPQFSSDRMMVDYIHKIYLKSQNGS